MPLCDLAVSAPLDSQFLFYFSDSSFLSWSPMHLYYYLPSEAACPLINPYISLSLFNRAPKSIFCSRSLCVGNHFGDSNIFQIKSINSFTLILFVFLASMTLLTYWYLGRIQITFFSLPLQLLNLQIYCIYLHTSWLYLLSFPTGIVLIQATSSVTWSLWCFWVSLFASSLSPYIADKVFWNHTSDHWCPVFNSMLSVGLILMFLGYTDISILHIYMYYLIASKLHHLHSTAVSKDALTLKTLIYKSSIGE